MHAMNHSRCYMHARPSCHVCIDFIKYHSQYNGVKEQCGPLFLSERKNELSVYPRRTAAGMGGVLLGTYPTCLSCLQQRPALHSSPSQDLWRCVLWGLPTN